MPTRLTWIIPLALVLSFSGCAARQAHVMEPSPCSDSLYVQLKRQHPDSLSQRSWERLQALEQSCAAARTQRNSEMNNETDAMMGLGSSRNFLWMGLLMVVGVGMALTMGRLR